MREEVWLHSGTWPHCSLSCKLKRVLSFGIAVRYANRAKSIKNQPKINEDPKDAMLREYQKQIDELRRRLEEGESMRRSKKIEFNYQTLQN